MAKNKILENIEIEKLAAEGKAIARVDGLVVFVKNAVPGDVVDIKITRKRKKFYEGVAVKFHKLSDKRVEPKCQHFGVCGGCKWQNLDYQQQIYYKHQQVVETFEHLAGISPKYIRPIVPSPETYFYRNKLEFTFSRHRWLTDKDPQAQEHPPALGFHAPMKFDKVVDIFQCWLQPEPSNQIRNLVRQLALENDFSFYDIRNHTGFLRNLVIRNNLVGEFMVMLIVAQDRPGDVKLILDTIAQKFPQVISLYYMINQKKNDSYADLTPVHYKGEKYLVENLDGLRFRIHPKSFFQTNTRQGLQLYRIAKEFADLSGDEVVYDLYTGTGTIALFVADRAKKVIGIEYIAEAIEDAQRNAQLNGINNAEFFTGDIKDIMTPEFFDRNGKPDVIILDPPRAGMHKNVVEAIKFAAPRRIVYVSCNPATQARDVSLLADMYDLEAAQPVDMFPHTHHVENVVLLQRKN